MTCKKCRLMKYCDGDCKYLEQVFDKVKIDCEDMMEWKDMYESGIFDELIVWDCVQSKRENWLWER